MAENHIFLIFVDSYLNFSRRTKIAINRPIFKIFAKIFSYMGPHYVNFTFAFDTTLIQLKITKICPNMQRRHFCPPSPWIGFRGSWIGQKYTVMYGQYGHVRSIYLYPYCPFLTIFDWDWLCFTKKLSIFFSNFFFGQIISNDLLNHRSAEKI